MTKRRIYSAVSVLSALFVIFLNSSVFTATSQNTQELYEEAKQHYIKDELNEAKELLNSLLRQNQRRGELISYGDNHSFKVEPAVMNMLGNIYLAENDILNATKMFTKMLKLYPHDFIYGPYDGERTFDGPAGAIALSSLISITSGLENVQPDYKKSIEYAYKLIIDYQGAPVQIWEGIFSWDESAASAILRILKNKNEPVWKREREVRKINRILKNEQLKADLMIEIGDLNRRSGQSEQALRIFREVIENHPFTFKVDEQGSGYFIVHSLDAYLGMIYTYKQYKYPENKHIDTTKEMKTHYEKFLIFLEHDYKGEYSEHYSDNCKRVYGTDEGQNEYMKRYMPDKYYQIGK